MKGLVIEDGSVIIRDDLEMPTPENGEVLVKVKYSSIHSFDVENVEGKNALLEKLMRVKKYPVRTGIEFSGIVETQGKRFKKGDRVFGYPDLTKGMKAHQEFIAINEGLLALMPTKLDFRQSAAIPVGALTSLVALEKVGKISKDAKVLVNGAAGGLGVYALQIAKIFEAKVTAVAGEGQEAFLKELGADIVINYKEQKIEDIDDRFDILLDLTTKVEFSNISHLLKPKGVFVPANPFTQLIPMIGNFFRKKKVGYLLVDKGNFKDLTRIAKWVSEDKIKPIIDTVYTFEEYKEGFERTTHKNKRGRIILEISK